MADEFDFEVAYMHPDYPGIAWRATAYKSTPNEDTEWTGYDDVDESMVRCHMVGDDRDFLFDISELIEISDEEYCSSCGQIGCGHG